MEIKRAEAELRNFFRKVEKYLGHKAEREALTEKEKDYSGFGYRDLQQAMKLESMAYEELMQFVDRVDSDRKFKYSKGWGVPREDERNIIFKMIENSEYNELFKEILDQLSKKRNADKSKSPEQ